MDYLKHHPDLWSVVRRYLPELPIEANGHVLTEEEIKAKFERGEAEHERDWLTWSPEDFDRAEREEIIDLVVYRAMRRALFGHADSSE